jgi:hypothetical protein
MEKEKMARLRLAVVSWLRSSSAYPLKKADSLAVLKLNEQSLVEAAGVEPALHPFFSVSYTF